MKAQAGVGSDNANQVKAAYAYVLSRPEDGGLVHLTNWQRDITILNLPAELRTANPTVFKAAQVQHSEIVQSSTFENRATQVSVGTQDDILKRYFTVASTVRISCHIIRLSTPALMEGDIINYETHAQVLNSGVVGAVGFKGLAITATITPEPFAGKLQVPRYHWSRSCNRVFGKADTGCPVNVDSWARTTTILSTTRSQRIVTLNLAPPFDIEDYFRGGRFLHESSNQIFSINWCDSQEGNTRVSLSTWSPVLTPGDLVKVFPGCRHTTADCSRYGNAENFGGFPFVPNRNPTMQGVKPTS